MTGGLIPFSPHVTRSTVLAPPPRTQSIYLSDMCNDGLTDWCASVTAGSATGRTWATVVGAKVTMDCKPSPLVGRRCRPVVDEVYARARGRNLSCSGPPIGGGIDLEPHGRWGGRVEFRHYNVGAEVDHPPEPDVRLVGKGPVRLRLQPVPRGKATAEGGEPEHRCGKRR